MTIKISMLKCFSNPNSKVRAIYNLTLPGFAVTGLQVVDGERGLFVQMPAVRITGDDGSVSYREVFYPITAECRSALCNAILDHYKSAQPVALALDETCPLDGPVDDSEFLIDDN